MKKPIRILIVEDNEDDAILEAETLRGGGFQISYKRVDSLQGLKHALKNYTWDALISDYSLPGFSGLDALAEYLEAGLDIPFIIVSGAIGEETAVLAMKTGAHDYIMKNNLRRLVPVLERELREAEIRRQKKRAEETNRFERMLLRTLIDHLPGIIYIKDTECRRIVSNQAEIKFAGLTSEADMIGKTDLEIYRDEFAKRSHATDLTVIQTGKPLFDSEEIIMDAESNQHWFLTSRIPLRNETNQISGIIGIAHDITERKKLEFSLLENEENLKKQNYEYEALNKEYSALNEEISESLKHIKKMNDELLEAKNKAEESDKLKSAFLANMSHEIRTPLNAILGFSSFLKNPEMSKGRTDEFVDIIEASGQQLLSIISDILEISQIESGFINISNETTNITKILNELFIQFRKDTTVKNLELVLNINKSSDDIVTLTDGNRVRQIMSNLLNNAVKFTPKGRIEFAARIANDQVLFYVKDTGIGIKQEDQRLIFEPFRQVETTMSRTYGGNGLGLSISRALVERLGGKLSLHSIPDKGSTFSFTIPYIKAEPVNKPPDRQNLFPQYNWGNHVILVAEDEFYNYRFLEEILSPTSVKLLHASNGREAVEMVEKNPDISLVIMDLKMPEMDGYKATRLIKELRPKLPVIAQTATVLSENKELARESGFDNYLSKPIEIKSFMETIDNFLE